MTDTVALDVKWNKDSFKVDFVIAGGVKGLKTELEEKTGVPADRMKLMAKSKGTSATTDRCAFSRTIVLDKRVIRSLTT